MIMTQISAHNECFKKKIGRENGDTLFMHNCFFPKITPLMR